MRKPEQTVEQAGDECARSWLALKAANTCLEALLQEPELYRMQVKVVAALAERYTVAIDEFVELSG